MSVRVRSGVCVLILVAFLVALAGLPEPVQSAPPSDPASRLPSRIASATSLCPPVRVYDYDGTERDWDWLVTTFGAVWVEPGDGSACLAELRAIHDDATLNVRVRDSDGQPADGIPVIFHWPDAPFLPPELVGCYDRGVYGITGEGHKSAWAQIDSDPGSVGFGMGGGAFYCPPSGGPHTVWTGVEGSDCVHGLGMLCWTNHDHVDPTFVLYEGSLPSPVLAPIDNGDKDGAYLVDWSTVEGATAYTLEEDSSASFPSPIVRYQGAATQYAIASQAPGTWHYRVRASGAGGDSPWSNIQQATVSMAPPGAPILYPIDNDDGDGSYWVDWSEVPGATKYRLEEDDHPSFASPIVRYLGYNVRYQVTGRSLGLRYYRVRTSNAAGFGPWSNTESAAVGGPPPGAPVLYPIDNGDGDGSYLVDWSEVPGATKYRLEEDDNADFGSPLVRYLGYGTQYQVTARPPGLRYYRVRTSNASGYGPWSNTEWAIVGPGGAWHRPARARL
ncbi:MAG TPA: hypothetical protein PKO09_03460 [Anaerolineae bacterium]|nr:hypothetical protein [Anaerolineae bacterium]